MTGPPTVARGAAAGRPEGAGAEAGEGGEGAADALFAAFFDTVLLGVSLTGSSGIALLSARVG